MALVPCIAISTGYILLIMFLCELARRTVAPLNDGLVKTALNEAIAAADLCGVCFELIISECRSRMPLNIEQAHGHSSNVKH